jgi:hypothetical protein
MAVPALRWKHKISRGSLKAAEHYLSLCHDPATTAQLVKQLRNASLVPRRADDILDAARRPPLPADDPRLVHLRAKLEAGKKLPPVLMVTGPGGPDVANGKHRTSLAWHQDPATVIPVAVAHLGDEPSAA